jgi:hypothetical protein
LDDDRVEYFEILLEYMISGSVASKDAFNIIEPGQIGLKRCLVFIEYSDKYGMGDASSAVHDSLEKVLPTTKVSKFSNPVRILIQPCDVEVVFKVTPSGSSLRVLITKAALSTNGLRGKT